MPAAQKQKQKQKLDLYRIHKAEYAAPKKPSLVNTKPAQYLTIEGKGSPEGGELEKKIGALYSVAYTLKMAKKFAGKDYTVCHLEGLWWGKGGDDEFVSEPPSTWNWKLIIRVPDFIKEKDVQQTTAALLKKGKPPEVGEVKLETIDEGPCVQMLHVGPYGRENETVAQMLEFAKEEGLGLHGKHHEIYLSDPRRIPPERLRTIIRHPVTALPRRAA
jgi:hypothetical protein